METSARERDEACIRRILSLSEEEKDVLFGVINNGDLEVFLEMQKDGELEPLKELRVKKPQVLKNIFADYKPDTEQVLDYVQDLEIRLSIFEELSRLAGRVGQRRTMTMAVFAIFMVAPIAKLNEVLEHQQNNDELNLNYFFQGLSAYTIGAIKLFANRGGRQSHSASGSSQSSPTPSPSPAPANPLKRKHERTSSSSNLDPQALAPPTREPPLPVTPTGANIIEPLLFSPRPPSVTSFARHKRSHNATKTCKMRDRYQCVIMGTPDPEGAHIVLFGAVKNASAFTLDDMIKTFWESDQSNVWRDLLNQTNVLESAQNLISLNHQLHWWMDNGRMALKPLRKLDDKSIVVQFHWLKLHQTNCATIVRGQGETMGEWLRKVGLDNNSAWGNIRSHRQSGIPLETGQTFVLEADDPSHVPNFELLKLSWDILRIIAISGAAEPQDLSDDDCSGNGDIDLRVDYESNASIWNEDDYAELRHWAGKIENDELGHDTDSNN